MSRNTPRDLDRYRTYKVGDEWYVQPDGQQLWGQGDSLDAAMADLQRRTDEYAAFRAKSGMQALDSNGFFHGVRRAYQSSKGALKVIVVVALCAVPLSYGISTGITRGIENADIKGGKAFWGKVEKGILKMGEDGKGLPPEKAEALHKAVGNIVERIRPFSSKLGLLFVPPEQDAQDQ